MNAIDSAREQIESSHGWKIDPLSVEVVDSSRNIWMAMVTTTRMGDAGLPERYFAIHVVDGVLSPEYAQDIPLLKVALTWRERRLAA